MAELAGGPALAPGPDGAEGLLGRYPDASPPATAAGAAVLIVLRPGAAGLETLLIERAQRPGDRASGHVALPGGRVGPEDRDLRDTALREFAEEVGLSSDDLSGPPRFVAIEPAPVFEMDVGVFAGRLRPGAPPARPASREEVAHVFWLPVGALDTAGRVRRESRGQLHEVDAVLFEGHVLWGFTLRVLRRFFFFSLRSVGAASRGTAGASRAEPPR